MTTSSQKRQRIYTSIIGDAGHPHTHSGFHYYFLQAARTFTELIQPLNLDLNRPAVRSRKSAWVAARLATLRKPRGYQYTDAFLEQIWAPSRARVRNAIVINFFQLYPQSLIEDSQTVKCFYIDLTLRQLFDMYGVRKTIGRDIGRDAERRERLGYESAAVIVAMSAFAAESCKSDYGIDPAKILVALPGANLTARSLDATNDPPLRSVGEFVIGFVGKEWQRKGLDRLISATQIARGKGANVRLRIVGCQESDVPKALRRQAFVEWLGRIDKCAEPDRFVNILSSCHLGALLTRADASPIALREFLSLGIPIIITDVGGCREMAPTDATICLRPDSTSLEIAEAIERVATSCTAYDRLRVAAWAARKDCTWEKPAKRVLESLL